MNGLRTQRRGQCFDKKSRLGGVDVSNWSGFPALHDETKEGWVWVYPQIGRQAPSTHIRISNPKSRRSVVCEQRVIDKNFISHYNEANAGSRFLPRDQKVIVASWHYRQRLDMEVGDGGKQELGIVPAQWPLAGVCAGLAHPSSEVPTATGLGLLALALGIVSVALAVVIPRSLR